MPPIPNDSTWNDGDDDGFVDEDEDEIEIVSLLGHNDHQTTSSANSIIGPASGQSTNSKNKTKKSVHSHLVGVFAIIILVLLSATILLSRSSSRPYISSSNKNDDPSSSTITEIESENISSDGDSIKKNNEKENYQNPATESENGGAGDTDKDVDWFVLETGNSRIDRAYQLAMDELHQNIEYDADGSPYFVAGARRGRSWTRNVAYAVDLAGGLVQPDVSRLSLEACTERASIFVGEEEVAATVWHQDTCADIGGWPNLSDAIVGARGAWHLYLYTGNSTFLEWAYETTVRSLLRAELEAFQNTNDTYFEGGLFGGSSSYMESNSGYSEKYKDNWELVGKTKALSTNILYYNGYYYAYKMGTILMENSQLVNSLKARSEALKLTIRERLWTEEKGAYAHFEDEEGNLVNQTEGLGLALAMLSERFESHHRIALMFGNDNLISEGFRNGRVWPFVSGYFAIAAARHGHLDIFAETMANIIDFSEQQNTFAEYYEPDKSFERHRSRQLLSDAGYLGMVYKGLFGIDFQKRTIEFSPNKVEGKDGVLKTSETISLRNVKYRNAILDIFVTGFGTNVTSFKLNGELQELPKIDSWLTGRQKLEIEVAPSTS